jgi:hypothetical protein
MTPDDLKAIDKRLESTDWLGTPAFFLWEDAMALREELERTREFFESFEGLYDLRDQVVLIK